MLRKKSAVEGFEPFHNRVCIILLRKGLTRKSVYLRRPKAKAQHIVQIEVMQLIGPHKVLRPLADFSSLRRQKLRTHRRIQHIEEYIPQRSFAAALRVIVH